MKGFKCIGTGNNFECRICYSKKIEEVPAKPTEYGAPSHYRKCKKCGQQDGPWIKAEDHWSGGWL